MPNPRQPRLSAIFDRLRERSFRLTKKRERILGALTTFDRPASAEEIRDRAGLPSTDLVTVYRNLETFVEAGVMQRLPLENGSNLFELTAPDEHYHHLVCRRCHRAERIEVCFGDQLVRDARARGYTELAHVLEVYGVCTECAESPVTPAEATPLS